MNLTEIENLSNNENVVKCEDKLHFVTDAEQDKARFHIADKPSDTENMTFSVSLKRRHSTGTFIMEAETTSCKDDGYAAQHSDLRIRKLSRQFSHENFIQNIEAIKCSRFYSRRNALCDPLRMLIPQHMREQLEHNVEQRKTSVTRKVSQFITVSLDLNREEELI
jgi:hypothetical protein